MSRITFGGLASGLDTNDLINKLLEIERLPILNFQQKILNLQKQRDAWKDINMRLRNLRDTLQGMYKYNTQNSLFKQENFIIKQALSTDYAVVASAAPNAANGVYDFTVQQLAASHTVAMGDSVQSIFGKSQSQPLARDGTFSLNGVNIRVVNDDSLESLRDKINASDAKVTASIVAGRLVLKSQADGAGSTMNMSYVSGEDILSELQIYKSTFYNQTPAQSEAFHTVAMKNHLMEIMPPGITDKVALGLSGSFIINGQVVTIDPGDTLGDFEDIYGTPVKGIVSKINEAGAGVTASIEYVTVKDDYNQILVDPGPPPEYAPMEYQSPRLIIKSDVSGSAGAMTMSYLSGQNVLDILGIHDGGSLNTVTGDYEGGEFYNVIVSDLSVTTTTTHTVKMKDDIQTMLGVTDTTVPMGLEGVFSINGVKVEVKATDSLDDLVGKINVIPGVSTNTVISDDDILTTLGLSDTAGLVGYDGTISVNGVDISVDSSTTTLKAMLDSINSISGVSAYIDDDSGKLVITGVTSLTLDPVSIDDLLDIFGLDAPSEQLVITSDTPGAEGAMKFSYISGDDVLEKLGIFHEEFFNEVSAAQDAIYTIDGLKLTSTTNEISDVVDGVTFYLQDVSDKKVSIQISTDTSKATEAIQAFVEQYNSVNSYIRERLQKPENVPNKPLSKVTENQEVTDSTIGLLQGNTTLQRIERNLRNLINSPIPESYYLPVTRDFDPLTGVVEYNGKPHNTIASTIPGYRHIVLTEEDDYTPPKYTSFSSIGVMTLDKEGNLMINNSQLQKALEDDPEAVLALFDFEIKDEFGLDPVDVNAVSETTGLPTGARKTQSYGLTYILDNYLKMLLVSSEDSFGRATYPVSAQQETYYQNRIDELERRIAVKEERILRYEDRLVRQFTNLETFIANMQTQSDYFERLLTQLQNSTSKK